MRKMIIVAMLTAMPWVARAEWASTGHWEFAEQTDYNSFPDKRWAKTVVLDIYSAKPSRQQIIRQELREMAGMSSSAGIESLYDSLISEAHKRANDLVKTFKLGPSDYKHDKFQDDYLAREIMLVSHKLNAKVSGEIYTFYDSYEDLQKHHFKKQWLNCSRSTRDSASGRRLCSDMLGPNLSSTMLRSTAKTFNKIYRFSPSNSSFVLFNPKTFELLVATYRQSHGLDAATLYPINIKTGKGGEPLNITEFRY